MRVVTNQVSSDGRAWAALIVMAAALAACGSVTANGTDAGGDVAAAGTSGAAGTAGAAGTSSSGGTTGTGGSSAGASGAAGTHVDAGAHDAPRELGSEVYGTVFPQCPAFKPDECAGTHGVTAGGQKFGHCYKCTDQKTGAAVADCVNGAPGDFGGACVASCTACDPP